MDKNNLFRWGKAGRKKLSFAEMKEKLLSNNKGNKVVKDFNAKDKTVTVELS